MSPPSAFHGPFERRTVRTAVIIDPIRVLAPRSFRQPRATDAPARGFGEREALIESPLAPADASSQQDPRLRRGKRKIALIFGAAVTSSPLR